MEIWEIAKLLGVDETDAQSTGDSSAPARSQGNEWYDNAPELTLDIVASALGGHSLNDR